jgi:molybdopterin-guanine dinucleotide biosynthesis protein MobB
MHITDPDRIAELFPVPMIGFAAFSGTGKTTLLLKLLPLLKQAGLRVAVVKHAHHTFEMDQPGKDSYRLREAGADEMLVAARCRIGFVRECKDSSAEPRLSEAVSLLEPGRLDLVLVEGFKREPIPKIELHRASLGRPLLFPRDPNIVAIACDSDELAHEPLHIPKLSIDRPNQIASFILDRVGRRTGVTTGIAG